MQISKIVEQYNLIPIQLLYPSKKYRYTCVLENALDLKEDFIYFPFVLKKDEIFDNIFEAMSNPHCKGFVINIDYLKREEFINKFHILMKSQYKNIEVLLLAKNLYNTAFFIGERLTQKFENLQVITVSGTQNTSCAVQMLSDSMKNKIKITKTEYSWDIYQKALEPILMADKNTKYAIVEAIPERKHLFMFIKNYRKNNIIYLKTEPSYIDIWGEVEALSDEFAKLLDIPANIKSIYSLSENEIINRQISYKMQNKLYFVKTNSKNEFKQDFYYLNDCYKLVSEFLIQNKIRPIKSKKFFEANGLYGVLRIRQNDYFILNPEKFFLKPIKETLKLFFNLNLNKQKIVIIETFSGANNLYKETVYKDLFAYIAGLNPDVLILLGKNPYIKFYKMKNKNTYVKIFPFKSGNTSNERNVQLFLDGIKTNNASIYVASADNTSYIFDRNM